jgi:hypothetical protein
VQSGRNDNVSGVLTASILGIPDYKEPKYYKTSHLHYAAVEDLKSHHLLVNTKVLIHTRITIQNSNIKFHESPSSVDSMFINIQMTTLPLIMT